MKSKGISPEARKALQRPKNYFELDEDERIRIDDELGISDWAGPDTEEEILLLEEHHNIKIVIDKKEPILN